jgi:Asp/Glu/hydantoin racemase
MANTLADVQATFLLLDSQLNMLLAAARTPYQKGALMSQYETAKQNYEATLYAALAEDDAQVTALGGQLKAANSELTRSTASMDDIDEVIDRIASAVKLSSQLISMAGPGPGH